MPGLSPALLHGPFWENDRESGRGGWKIEHKFRGKRIRANLGILLVLWLSAVSLRVTILALPPLLPAIHRDLRLEETLVGILSSLPVLLLAVAAVWGSLLVARVGARRALILGLALVAIAGALRGVGTSTAILFTMTLLMGIGVALSQPTLPTLTREWFSQRSTVATAVYSNGFLIGEIVAAALTVPLVLPLVRGSWQLAFSFWSIPVALTAVALIVATPHRVRGAGAPQMQWWPDWRSARTWRLGLILGCASASYFGSNAFLPDYLRATHHPALIAAALTSINLSQLPASLLAALFPRAMVARTWPVMAAGTLTALAAAGFLLGGVWVVVCAGLLGFSTATVFVLTIALPPLLVEEHDVHRLSAAIFTITYACPFVISLIGGAVWDATGVPYTAFLPVAATGFLMICLVIGLDLSSAMSGSGPVSSRYRDEPTQHVHAGGDR
jgi:MFS transporter, CP family, cyanate transporter